MKAPPIMVRTVRIDELLEGFRECVIPAPVGISLGQLGSGRPCRPPFGPTDRAPDDRQHQNEPPDAAGPPVLLLRSGDDPSPWFRFHTAAPCTSMRTAAVSGLPETNLSSARSRIPETAARRYLPHRRLTRVRVRPPLRSRVMGTSTNLRRDVRLRPETHPHGKIATYFP